MQYPPRTRLSIIFASISCVLIFHQGLHPFRVGNTIENYYSYAEDALPSAEDPKFWPKSESIFFHETSFYGELTARQACSVEAAARTNPQNDIYVLFTSPVTENTLKTTCLAKLLQFHNVKLVRVHIAEYSKGTPVHSILVNSLRDSQYPIQHTADILRILTLSKFGGVGIDANSDMVIVAPLDPLPPNWIVKHSEKHVAPGILAFSNEEGGKNITKTILKEIFETYDPEDFSVCGRKAIQAVVQRMCPVKIHWRSCGDIAILPHSLFYSMEFILWKIYHGVTNFETSFSFRMWDIQSEQTTTQAVQYRGIENPRRKLARKYCPSIYSLYADQLGL